MDKENNNKSCRWCASNIYDIPRKELYDDCICSDACKKDEKTWNDGRIELSKEIYEKFRDNCIVIDLDGATQVITEKKLKEILSLDL